MSSEDDAADTEGETSGENDAADTDEADEADDAEGADELAAILPEKMSHEDWGRLLRRASGPGHADVVILGPDPENQRALGLAVLGGLLSAPTFRLVLVVAPPSRPVAVEVAVHARRVLAANGHADASQRVMHHQLTELDAAAVARLGDECGEDALIYVVSAGQFRFSDVDRAVDAALTEDVWVQHVARLATELGSNIRRTSYALLDVGHMPPIKKKHVEMLEGLPGRVITMEISKAVAWARVVTSVRADDPSTLDAALAAIAASGVDAKGVAMLQATALRNAERHVAALGAISRFWEEWLATAEPGVLTELAQIAMSADEPSKAREALESLPLDALPIELLERALHTARRAGARDLEQRLIERLTQISPSSTGLSRHLVDRAMGARDWRQLASLAADAKLNLKTQEREYLGALASALLENDVVSSTRQLAQRFPDRRGMSVLLAGREAIRRRLYAEALALLAAAPAGADALRAASLILDTLELVLFERAPDGGFAIPDELLAATIAFVASRIATAPRDTQLRVKLAQVLAADVVGTRGEALLLFLVERLAASSDEQPTVVRTDEPASLDEARDFLELVAGMAERSGPGRAYILGAGELPTSITAETAMRLVPIAGEALSRLLDDVTDDRSLAATKVVLHGALLTCIRANSRRDGIRMLRGTAVHLANHGWAQEARDIAEHALNWANDDPGELRLAWTAFSDVYHRLGDLHDSLVGMLLAASLQEARLTREERWHETHLMVRLLRDLGLHDEALAMVAKAEPLLTMTPRWTARMESIKLAIELRKHDALGRAVPDSSLMGRLAANLRRLLDLNEDVTPSLVLLMQLIARTSAVSAEISVDQRALVETALSSLPGPTADRLRALGDPNASLATVRALTSRLGAVRFSEDVGYDIQAAALASQRALSHAESLEPSSVIELIELLADRTVVTPADIHAPDAWRSSIAHLSAAGHVVHMLGFDDAGRLVRATVDGSDVEVRRELQEVFSPPAFSEWKKKHPYEYSKMDDPKSVMGDAVRRSVDHLGISSASSRSTVIVPDVRMSVFPMNLLRLDNDFIGAEWPVATVPSLAWLAARMRPPRTMTGRRVAWISDAPPQGDESPALGPLAERLEPVLTEHGFAFSRSSQISRDLSNADVAVVIAHGGLLPDARFFQVLRDDASERWSPRAIADAVANAGCVVMFVCSAGRHDEHPRARATVGLTRLLLERGVRAVVASPWPLDTRVPPRWLPTFLKWLDHGEPISDAVFALRHPLKLLRRFRTCRDAPEGCRRTRPSVDRTTRRASWGCIRTNTCLDGTASEFAA